MKVVITGGGGFIGSRLAHRLLEVGELTGPDGSARPIDIITLLDIGYSDGLPVPDDARVERATGEATDGTLLRTLIDRDDVAVFHLASMVSSACEADFDAALRVNLGAVQAVLEAARARPSRPRVIFASSLAVFGGEAVAGTVTDTTKLTPETTYGTTKAIGELLVNDYTRKGFVDGRSARLPTVVIRPGRPNAAASSWVSGIFREPLNGQQAVVPVGGDIRVPISGYRTVVDNLIRLHQAPGEAIGPDRAVTLPSIAVTAREMAAALTSAAGDRELGPIVHRPDPLVERIFAGWAQTSSFQRATELNLLADEGLEPIIRGYLEDFLG
ncbi:MAG TPA: D-erythronate dehydrogenase [Nakamurella sp.]|nr:D-erythronate dehydrogenase [Nakamurella sp.]